MRAYAKIFPVIAIVSLCCAGCWDQHPTTGDKNTNWLMPCSEHDACVDDLACIGGLCTVPCDTDAACAGRSIAARCELQQAPGAGRRCVELTSNPGPIDGGMQPQPMQSDAATPMTMQMPDAQVGQPMQPTQCSVDDDGRAPGPFHTRTMATGQGPCSATTLSEVLGAIGSAHAAFSTGLGYVFDPESPPPPAVSPFTVFAFDTSYGYAIAIEEACEGECATAKRTYFRTDEACEPVLLGTFGPVTIGMDCADVVGLPLWDQPPPSPLNVLCDEFADPEKLPIRFVAHGCGSDLPCSKGQAQAGAHDLTIEVGPTRAMGSTPEVLISGSGHPVLEDFWFPVTTWSGRTISIEHSGTLPTECHQEFHVSAVFDLDGNQRSYLNYEESLVPDCVPANECKGSLNLDFGRLLEGDACFAVQDITRSVGLAQAPLLECETSADCTTVPFATDCVSGCALAVRLDRAAELEAAITRIGNAYCPDATCNVAADCPSLTAVCLSGRCETRNLE